jgi:hypothetical protein
MRSKRMNKGVWNAFDYYKSCVEEDIVQNKGWVMVYDVHTLRKERSTPPSIFHYNMYKRPSKPN